MQPQHHHLQGSAETAVVREDDARPRRRRRSLTLVSALVLGLGLAIAPALVPASAPVPAALKPDTASAATTYCGWPRCTVYLNKDESRRFAYGPWIPSTPLNPYIALWQVFSGTHKAIALWYVNNGYCVGFRLSAVPWETQGMFGYRC
jgi:hypothetical protein